MGGGGNWIRRIVAPWSYKGSEILTSIVDPFNLTGSQDETKAQDYKAPEVAATPEIEVPQDATAVAAAKTSAKKRARAMSKSGTVYTNPLGLADTAEISRNTLLGQ